MLLLSEAFGLDVILGAFLAGVIVRMLLPEDHDRFLARLDGIGFGLLIPVFFVVSGMAIDFGAVLDDWRSRWRSSSASWSCAGYPSSWRSGTSAAATPSSWRCSARPACRSSWP